MTMEILEITLKTRDLFERYELCRLQADQVRILAERLQREDVTISVIGQFKRGKTTLVNSILGSGLLPVGIVPITAAVTRIRYKQGETSSTVHFLNGLSKDVPVGSVREYISEQENHDNAKGVAEVELKVDSGFLKDGLVIVDTPGVGSVYESNSKSAYDFAKESDGVIFMLSVDSPVNKIEVDFLKSVQKFAGKFYFAVNKTDTVDGDDLSEYLDYCTALISDIMGYEADGAEARALKLIPVSAKKNIGINELTTMIREDLVSGAADIMKRSVGLKLLEILRNTSNQIKSYREVLRMAPNVFNMKFSRMESMLNERREHIQCMAEGKYLRARLNEEKAFLTEQVREIFGIEYYYYVDRGSASELLSRQEYVSELLEIYDELAETLNAIFMYKEEDAYAVARRIEDLNILIQEMRVIAKQIEGDLEKK